MIELNLNKVLDKILELELASGIAVIFALIYFFQTRQTIKLLYKNQEIIIDKIQEANNKNYNITELNHSIKQLNETINRLNRFSENDTKIKNKKE